MQSELREAASAAHRGGVILLMPHIVAFFLASLAAGDPLFVVVGALALFYAGRTCLGR